MCILFCDSRFAAGSISELLRSSVASAVPPFAYPQESNVTRARPARRSNVSGLAVTSDGGDSIGSSASRSLLTARGSNAKSRHPPVDASHCRQRKFPFRLLISLTTGGLSLQAKKNFRTGDLPIGFDHFTVSEEVTFIRASPFACFFVTFTYDSGQWSSVWHGPSRFWGRN